MHMRITFAIDMKMKNNNSLPFLGALIIKNDTGTLDTQSTGNIT